MEIKEFKPNEEAIERRRKIEPFGATKDKEGLQHVIKLENGPKFNRADIVEVNEKAESKGVYVYKPKYEFVNEEEKKAGGNFYMPPSLRNVQTSIKINNIPLDLDRDNLYKIIENMGLFPISTYVVLDYESKESRGYAYVAFSSIESAKEAVNKIDGYIMDGLIFGAEIAKNQN
ncbi:Serine arginine-rich splicing factor [Gurleya vavrai]